MGDDGELTAAEKKLIADRMADFEKNPHTSIPWAEAEGRIKARWGSEVASGYQTSCAGRH